jgi:hypothetical protein
MDDPFSRLIAAILTVVGMFIVAFVTHRLTVAREHAKQSKESESGQVEKFDAFMKTVHSPVIRRTHEIETLIDDLLTNHWNPESEEEWKKIKKERFSAMLIVLGSLQDGLKDLLDTVTPYMAILPAELAEILSKEIPILMTDLEILKTLEKEKSEKPAIVFGRLSKVKSVLSGLREQFDVKNYREFLNTQ